MWNWATISAGLSADRAFKVTGVNYPAARAWFFTLATITALLGYGIVKRISG
jgi:hypothetical protein